MQTNHSSTRLLCRAFVLCCVAACCLAVSAVSAAESDAKSDAAKPAVSKSAKAGGNVPSAPPSLQSAGWESMFDGKTLKGWKETDFAGKGEVRVEDGRIVMEMGVMTGVTYTNPVPRTNYEVSLQAMRVDGSDFFCALTFPVGQDNCSLIVGGWGGGLVGLSSLDGMDASSNETTGFMNFKKGQWYHIRLRVTPTKIQAWIDEDKMVDVVTADHKIGIRSEVEQSVPFGLATWSTTGAAKDIRIRPL